MGREIRRVPANWEHPKYTSENARYSNRIGSYMPLYDEDFETAAREWLNECIAWENGTHPDLQQNPEYKQKHPYFWTREGNPPDEDSYRPKFETEPTWYQVYETVSEGTPVTPPFATKAELIDYLVKSGDFWDQERGSGGWARQAAEQFVEREWAPSLMVLSTPEGNVVHSPRDGDIP